MVGEKLAVSRMQNHNMEGQVPTRERERVKEESPGHKVHIDIIILCVCAHVWPSTVVP